jgi:CDP-glycerol glycerophosphotransferase
MSFISINQARDKNYRRVFIIMYAALGDQLLLMYAAHLFHKFTGEKILLGTTRPDIFSEHFDFCDIISGLNVLTIGGKYFADLTYAGIQVSCLLYHVCPPKIPDNKQSDFQFKPIHIIAQLLSQMGYSGEVILAPEFHITGDEKKFGRFFDTHQIAIISRGKELRKTWGVGNVQEVVNALKDVYNFVQIGAPNDPLLDGVLDKRGKFPIRQVAAILSNSDLFVGGIGALMHLARGVNCGSIITYSLSESLSTASYPCNQNITASCVCTKCQKEILRIGNEKYQCKDNFSCIRKIHPDMVISAIKDIMNTQKPKYPEVDKFSISANLCKPLTSISAQICSIYAKKLDNYSQKMLS